jgi:chromosome partitioning protein
VPTISVLSLKGGVGKTSVVLGLAAAAGSRGLATLVIDLDPQGNATSVLCARRPRLTVADVLAAPGDGLDGVPARSTWSLSPGRVDVLAGSPDAIRFDAWTGATFRPRLARALKGLEGYDLVLIDCPPSLGALTREALAASDLGLVVTTPSYFGAQGVQRAVDEIAEIRRTANPGLRFGGIVLNRVRTPAEEHTYRAKELNEIYGRKTVLKPMIPERIAMQQAEGSGQPVHQLGSSGGREIADIFDTHLKKLLKRAAADAVPQPTTKTAGKKPLAKKPLAKKPAAKKPVATKTAARAVPRTPPR